MKSWVECERQAFACFFSSSVSCILFHWFIKLLFFISFSPQKLASWSSVIFSSNFIFYLIFFVVCGIFSFNFLKDFKFLILGSGNGFWFSMKPLFLGLSPCCNFSFIAISSSILGMHLELEFCILELDYIEVISGDPLLVTTDLTLNTSPFVGFFICRVFYPVCTILERLDLTLSPFIICLRGVVPWGRKFSFREPSSTESFNYFFTVYISLLFTKSVKFLFLCGIWDNDLIYGPLISYFCSTFL